MREVGVKSKCSGRSGYWSSGQLFHYLVSGFGIIWSILTFGQDKQNYNLNCVTFQNCECSKSLKIWDQDRSTDFSSHVSPRNCHLVHPSSLPSHLIHPLTVETIYDYSLRAVILAFDTSSRIMKALPFKCEIFIQSILRGSIWRGSIPRCELDIFSQALSYLYKLTTFSKLR